MANNKNEQEAENFINVGIVFNEKGEVLIIKRFNSEIGKDGSVLTWAFPGGRQRLQESRRECVKRKILARTGYDVQSFREISLRLHPQFSVFIVYHLCKLVSAEQVQEPSEPHEVAEIRWVKPQELKSLATSAIDPEVSKILGLTRY